MGLFLSDLCGREAAKLDFVALTKFLSDLCGREGIGVQRCLVH